MKEIFKSAKRMVSSLLPDGSEQPDPTPLEQPLGFRRPETIQDQIRRMIRTEASLYAQENEMDTFEEADDFEVGDDFDPTTPYELDFDHENADISELQNATEAGEPSGENLNFVQEVPATDGANPPSDSSQPEK